MAGINLMDRHMAIAAAPHLENQNGSIISTKKALAMPVKKMLVSIEPVQSGSGDPSPTNVRPISGWTGARVTRCGKNLFDGATCAYSMGNDEAGFNVTYNKSNHGISFISKIFPNKTYTITAKHKEGLNIFRVILFKYYPEHNVGYSSPSESKQLTIIAGNITVDKTYSFSTSGDNQIYNYVVFTVGSSQSTFDSTAQAQLELGSTATDYEPYQGETYDITFPSEAGTVYGGTLDVTTGLLTVDRRYNSATAFGGKSATNANDQYLIYRDAAAKTNAQVICNMAPQGSIFSSALTAPVCGFANDTLNLFRIAFPKSMGIDTIDKANALISASGLHYVYELATPQTYQLTPTQVALLAGENNVWADTGDITMKFWSH